MHWPVQRPIPGERERERERYVPLDIIASIASLHVVRGCVSGVYKDKKCIYV